MVVMIVVDKKQGLELLRLIQNELDHNINKPSMDAYWREMFKLKTVVKYWLNIQPLG